MTGSTDKQTPRERGYRMPAEWEPHAAIWLQWPGRHPAADADDYTYQMCLEKTWVLMASEIHRRIAGVCKDALKVDLCEHEFNPGRLPRIE